MLKEFCRKHELDTHLVDSSISYSENKNYLESLIPDFSPERHLKQWEVAEEQYMKEHFAWYYMSCVKERGTTSPNADKISIAKTSFSAFLSARNSAKLR